MTRRLLPFAFALLTPAAALAQHFHHHVEAAPEDNLRLSVCTKPYTTPVLSVSQQGVEWIVTSRSEKAKEHFRQGLTLYYGFNYEDALRNFREATRLDDRFVMGWWGMALAAGPNINIGIENTCLASAREWSKRARDLARTQQQTLPSVEVDLAEALRTRYGNTGLQEKAYARAMERVWSKHHPHADVGALYAESLMDLHPWDLYDQKHNPRPWTQPVLDVLTEVLDHDHDALGANHYWLHAVEAGPKPDLAKDAAAVLELKVPRSGHLRHMPSHYYFLSGRYLAAVKANDNAVGIDYDQFGGYCKGTYKDYSDNKSCLQLYYGHYYAHNLFFRAVAKAFIGQNNSAIDDALATQAHAARFLPNEPGLERYLTPPYLLYAALGGWAPIESLPAPDCTLPAPFKVNSGCHIALATYHWAQGMAYTTSPKDLRRAQTERDAFQVQFDAIPEQATWGNNKARDMLAIAKLVLLARIDWAGNNKPSAIENLKLAIDGEDALVYDEPPQWFFPVRQSLGGAYLALGGKPNADAARKVFLEDLDRHKENGRSLYGMWRALTVLEQPVEAEKYRLRYREAWKDANPPVDLQDRDLWLLGW